MGNPDNIACSQAMGNSIYPKITNPEADSDSVVIYPLDDFISL